MCDVDVMVLLSSKAIITPQVFMLQCNNKSFSSLGQKKNNLPGFLLHSPHLPRHHDRKLRVPGHPAALQGDRLPEMYSTRVLFNLT